MEPRRKKPRASKKLVGHAKRLRREMTEPERLLWSILRAKQLDGLKFRRQHPIAGYVVDFYCEECKLVVELDGLSHVGRGDDDDQRTSELERFGLKVIRFTNDDVLKHLEAVAVQIARTAGLDW